MNYEVKIHELEEKLNQQHEVIKVLYANVIRNSHMFDVAMKEPEVKWKVDAIALAIEGKSRVFIAEKVGKTRQTISTYLNKPEIKEAIKAQL
jgi:hypothetical protein